MSGKFLNENEIKAIETGIKFYNGEKVHSSELPRDIWPLPKTEDVECEIIKTNIHELQEIHKPNA